MAGRKGAGDLRLEVRVVFVLVVARSLFTFERSLLSFRVGAIKEPQLLQTWCREARIRTSLESDVGSCILRPKWFFNFTRCFDSSVTGVFFLGIDQ